MIRRSSCMGAVPWRLHARLLLAAACLLATACEGYVHRDPVDQVSLERAMGNVASLVAAGNPARGGERKPGANRAAAEEVRDQFVAVGVQDVVIEEFHVPDFVPGASALQVVSPAPIAGSIDHLVNWHCGSATVTGELIDMGTGRRVDPAASGKIALMDSILTSSPRVQYDNAIASGAVGVLFNSGVTGSYIRQRHLWHLPIHGDIAGPIPAMSIGFDDVVQFRNSLLDGPVQLQMEAPSAVASAVGYNVIARIPGAVHPNRTVLINAHLDSWFAGVVDNAQAVAALVEIARAYRDVRPAYTLELVAFDAEENGLLGSNAYVRERFPEIRDELVAAITLEMLAPKEHDLVIATVDPHPRDDPMSPWGTVLDDSGLSRLFTLPTSASELMQAFYGEVPLDQQNLWAVGVPGFFVATLYEPYHTELDNADFADPERLEQVLRALVRAVGLLQEVPPEVLGRRPHSALTLDVSQAGAPTAGDAPSGEVTLLRTHDDAPIAGADVFVTLWTQTYDEVVEQAVVTEAGDGRYAYQFTTPLQSGASYYLTATAFYDFEAFGRSWVRIDVP